MLFPIHRKGLNLLVYPNPIDEETKFKYLLDDNGLTGVGHIVVTNIVGEKIAEYKLDKGFGEINFNRTDLGPGIYFCTLMRDGHMISIQKFIKE